MASSIEGTNTALKVTESAPAATDASTSKRENNTSTGKGALDRKRKRGSSKRAKRKGNRRRSNTPSSMSEVRIRRGSEHGDSSSPSYFAVEIGKPGGYDELKVVRKTGKGASGPNINMMIDYSRLLKMESARIGYGPSQFLWGKVAKY